MTASSLAESPGPKSRSKLLIAASSPALRRLLAARFEAEGFEVMQAVDATDAIACINAESPDSMLVTGNLGSERSGLRFLGRAPELSAARSLPIVVLAERGVSAELGHHPRRGVRVLPLDSVDSAEGLSSSILALLDGLHHGGDEELENANPDPSDAERGERLMALYRLRIAELERTSQRFTDVVNRVRKNQLAGPLVPGHLSEALTLLSDPEASIEDIARFVERDQTMAAKLLATANSAFYARGAPLHSVRNAVMRLGVDLTGEIVRALAACALLKGKHSGLQTLLTTALREAYLAALVTRALAQSRSLGTVSELYATALFHNIGGSLFLYHLSLAYERGDLPEFDCRPSTTLLNMRAAELNELVVDSLKLPPAIADLHRDAHSGGHDPGLRCVHQGIWAAQSLLRADRAELSADLEAQLLGLDSHDIDSLNSNLPALMELVAAYAS